MSSPLKNIKILIRADGGKHIGLGKLIPSIALAKKLQARGAKVLFVSVTENPELLKGLTVKLLPTYSFLHARQLTASLVQEFRPKVVVLNITDPDPYLGAKIEKEFLNWIGELRTQGIKVIGIEGIATQGYAPSTIVNWTVVPEWHEYKQQRGTTYFIGPEYVILRKRFGRFHAFKKPWRKECKQILVSLGGGTAEVERILFPRLMRGIGLCGFKGKTIFALGVASKDAPHLKKILQASRHASFYYNVSGESMAELMYTSDFALCAGGITPYELACVGTPFLTIPIVPHQLHTARAFQREGISKNIGMDPSKEKIKHAVSAMLSNAFLREQMSIKGKHLIDGRGLERVVGIVVDNLAS